MSDGAYCHYCQKAKCECAPPHGPKNRGAVSGRAEENGQELERQLAERDRELGVTTCERDEYKLLYEERDRELADMSDQLGGHKLTLKSSQIGWEAGQKRIRELEEALRAYMFEDSEGMVPCTISRHNNAYHVAKRLLTPATVNNGYKMGTGDGIERET